MKKTKALKQVIACVMRRVAALWFQCNFVSDVQTSTVLFMSFLFQVGRDVDGIRACFCLLALLAASGHVGNLLLFCSGQFHFQPISAHVWLWPTNLFALLGVSACSGLLWMVSDWSNDMTHMLELISASHCCQWLQTKPLSSISLTCLSPTLPKIRVNKKSGICFLKSCNVGSMTIGLLVVSTGVTHLWY